MRRGVKLAVVMTLLLALVAGVAYAGTIEGTPQDDVLTGTAIQDTILGRAGDDTISGLGHSDTLLGQFGNDTINGGPGHDVLRGNDGDDDLTGGPDETKGPRLTDEYYCGPGVDTVHLQKSESAVHNISTTCEIILRNE
jgi:Ca2+-binding RTX toxin-like protein